MAADVACCCASSWATRVGRSRASETADPAVMPMPNTAAMTSMALYAGGIRSMSCVTVPSFVDIALVSVMYDTMCANPYLGGVTMLRRVSVLALALALAACSDDSDSDVATIDQMRVVKVSGDQSAQVPPPEIAGALRVTATVGEDGWTDEPLIARIVTTGGGARATITGLSAEIGRASWRERGG